MNIQKNIQVKIKINTMNKSNKTKQLEIIINI